MTATVHETSALPPVIELRQYTLHPRRRDELIELFEREFVETQEACGMRLLGQFRDAGDPDRFVWMRGFRDMRARAVALGAFYGGPVWSEHRDAANATMIDSDNVLLLKPSAADAALPAATRPPPGTGEPASSRVLATVWYLRAPVDAEFRRRFAENAAPALAEAGAPPLATFETEYAPNSFPRLPVRAGEHVFLWLARFDDEAALATYEALLRDSARWAETMSGFERWFAETPERLVLEPTARSALR